MKQEFELLELAIENDELDLFIQGKGIYSLGENKFYPVNRSIMADEAMDVIYRYKAESGNDSVIDEVERCLCEWVTYKSGKGIYKAYEVLATILRSEKEGKATFLCDIPLLSKTISKAFFQNTELLKTIKENESANFENGVYELILNENVYYYKKYGFLVIRYASDAEIQIISDYIANEFGLKNERLGKAVDKLICFRDICEECIYYIKNSSFLDDENSLIIEGYSAKRLCDETYLKPIGAFNYLVSLRINPKVAIENLKKGLPRK